MLKASALLVVVGSQVAGAEDVPIPEGSEEQASEEEDDGRSLAVLPGAFYGQETGVGFAVLGMYNFPMRGVGPDTWLSGVTMAAVYTLKNQASLSLYTSFYLGEANDWSIESESFVEHFPTNYYGVGQGSEPSYQIFTRRRFSNNLAVRRRVHEQLYLGIADHLSVVDILHVQEPVEPDGSTPVVWTADDQLTSGNVPGGDGTRTHGLGLLARWDTRDNNQSTRTGAYVDLELAGYPKALGTISPFAQVTLDVRGFVPVGKGTLGGQWFSQVGSGDIPFTSMSELGGDDMMRGMFQGRYRDRSLTAAQIELRYPIIWRFTGVGFVGAGQVGHNPAELLGEAPRWSAGGGLRFELDRAAHTNIRIDVGSGSDGTGFIFNFGEAF